MMVDIPLCNSKGTLHLFFLQNTHNLIKQFFWIYIQKATTWNKFFQIKNVDVFTIVAILLSPVTSCGPCTIHVLATRVKRAIGKAAKSESNEGRYFRNFTVIV